MPDLERAESAQSFDLGRAGSHDPPAAVSGELPRVQPTRPAPTVDHDRLDAEVGRQGRQPPLVRSGQIARVVDATTLLAEVNLGRLCMDQKKIVRAEVLLRAAGEGLTRTLGPDHLNTLLCEGHLADLYYSQGNYKQAELLTKQILDRRVAKLGADHLHTLTSKNALAVILGSKENSTVLRCSTKRRWPAASPR